MKIQKRAGVLQDFDPTKILRRIEKQSIGLSVNPAEITIEVVQGLYDGVMASAIDELTAKVAASYTLNHPDYAKLASNILTSRLHKETTGSLKEYVKQVKEKLDKTTIDKINQYSKQIEEVIDFERDYNFDFFGLTTLMKSYLLKNESDNIVERPQFMYMRVALFLSENIEDFKIRYDLLSTQKMSLATPILYNSGTYNHSLISCNLTMLQDDSLDGIMDTIHDIAKSSADAAGIGLYIGNLRSNKSRFGLNNGKALGVIKIAKMVNETMRAFNQGGKRAGSCALYNDCYHKDIMDFLQLRIQIGSEEERAKDIFLGLNIHNNFIKAVEEDDDYYLFCPNEILKKGLKPLNELYGEAFEKEYSKAVDLGLGTKIKAREIWQQIIVSQIETGMPYVVNIDEVNTKSNHKHYGKIHQSNLCAEINQFQDANTTAQCCLGSIPVQKFVKVDGTYNFLALKEVSKETSKTLNVVINKNKYSTERGKKGGLAQRAIGIGLQGLADTFCMLGLVYDSEEAKELNIKISEAIYFGALEGSVEYFEETGFIYDGFEDSDYVKGILQYDYYGKTEEVEENSMFDWKSLKERIKKGCSNSLVTAYMPTANTAQIIGSNEAFEPFTANMYVRDTAAGEFYVINKYLINDLIKLDLWDDELRKAIINNKGKVYSLPNDNEYIKDLLVKIPVEIRERYKTVWEISQKVVINYAADRSIFIDQSQSMNLFIEKPTSAIISSMLMFSAKKGLKTCVYYMRSKPAREANAALGVAKSIGKKVEKPANSLFNCEGCSA